MVSALISFLGDLALALLSRLFDKRVAVWHVVSLTNHKQKKSINR